MENEGEVRGKHLGPNFDEKQGTKSWISRGERETVLQNLENREEKEKVFYKILKIERRKRNCSANLENREEKEKFNTKIL